MEEFIESMIETMYASPGTIGLAAPQAGNPVRLIVLDVTAKEKKNGLIVLMNPVLVRGEGSKVIREGCLSLPDYTGNVRRYERVVVKGIDRAGQERLIETSGVEAICFQHEIDHVDGMMFLDRVDSLKTDIFRRKKYL
jgi:peptide deformylase